MKSVGMIADISTMALHFLALFMLAQLPPVTVPTETLLYQTLPAPIQRNLLAPIKTDDRGRIGFNLKRWMDVADQRGVGPSLAMAVAAGDKVAAEADFVIIEKTFDMIRKDGTWLEREPDGRVDVPHLMAASNVGWLNAIIPAIEMLRQWSPSYEPRIKALKGRIAKAAAYAYSYKDDIFRKDQWNGNRLAIDARCFCNLSTYLEVPEYAQLGQSFLDRLFTIQQPDGVFPENGGFDTSYQAVTIRNLALLYTEQPSLQIRQGLLSGSLWFLSRFKTNGKLDVLGNTRTMAGETSDRGYDKDGNHPTQIAPTLNYILQIFPDTNAQKMLTKFMALAYENGVVVENPRRYLYNVDANLQANTGQ